MVGSECATETKGLAYLRCSTAQQLEGAKAQLSGILAVAQQLRVRLDVSLASFEEALKAQRTTACGDLFFDFGESGYREQNRQGYLDLLKRALEDPTITHVFVPARDRLARPENAAKFVAREHDIRAAGKYLVVGQQVLKPLRRGDDESADAMLALMEYQSGRKFLEGLSFKMVGVKVNGARQGWWAGGRPPYGFVRVLIAPDGKMVRVLSEKEHVRQVGFHVSLRVHDTKKLDIWHQILTYFDPLGANIGGKRIAGQLNGQSIPSPDAGRCRRTQYDRRPRSVPGTWTPGEVYARIDDLTIIGVLRWGKRGLGEHFRLGANGTARQLNRDEVPSEDRPAKVIENSEDIQITANGDWLRDGWLLDVDDKPCFEVDVALWERCQQKRRANSGSQKSVPRCHEPYRYPLAGLVRCAHCNGVMHGLPTSGGLRYTCGTYGNSGGAKCEHNWVWQDALLNDVLLTIRDTALPHSRDLRVAIREAAGQRLRTLNDTDRSELEDARREQNSRVKKALEAVSEARDSEERNELRKIYSRERAKLEGLDAQLRSTAAMANRPVDELVEAALTELHELNRALTNDRDNAAVAKLLRSLQVRLWLKFKKVPAGLRMLNKLDAGILCVGDVPDPVGLDGMDAEREKTDSLCMVNRGDWI